MRTRLKRYFSFIVSILAAYSCGHHDNRYGENSDSKDTIYSNGYISAIAKKDSVLVKGIGYDNWQIFWEAFTNATLQKDTTTILQLTNFPFLQNAYLTDRNEFLELWISQAYDLEKNDSSIPSNDFALQLGEHERASLPKFDSVRYTNKKGKDFYFARVNGYYRLVEIITPG
jgi:hypothetical protein